MILAGPSGTLEAWEAKQTGKRNTEKLSRQSSGHSMVP